MRITIFKESWNMICALNSPVYFYHSVLHEKQFFDWLLIIDRFTMGNITSVHVFMIQRKENHILFSYILLLSIINYHIKRRFTVNIGIYHSVFKITSFNRKIWQFLFLHATLTLNDIVYLYAYFYHLID